MGKRLRKAFLQGRYTGGQQTYENMLNITNANANQNQNEMAHHIYRRTTRKTKENKCWRDVEKLKCLCAVGKNVRLPTLWKII